MKQTLLLYFIFFTASITAQNIQWQNTIGGNDYDWCDFIEKTSDGNYISGGYSYSNISGDKNENSRGQNDFWFFKLDDLTGNLLWQKTIGGTSNDHLVSAKETTDGGYILGGYSSSGISGEKTQNTKGGDDYWVVKLDSNRNIVWDKTYGGTGTDRLTCIIETEDGGYLIGGESDSNISGDKNENSKGSIDIWVIKIDNLGTIVWQKTIGGNAADLISSISKTNDHKYVVVSSSSSNISGDKTQNSKGIFDYWILKLDLDGSIIWQNTIGGNNGDYAKSIIATADGNYFIGGDSSSRISGDKTENTINNSNDVWLVKLNNNGQLIWQKNFGGDDTEIFSNMRLTSDNGLVLGIMSYSGISGIKTEASQGNRDYWIIKLDSNNILEWDKAFGGSSVDQTQSIVQSNDGSYVIAGWSQSDISGDKTENKSGLQDFWILKFNVCNTAEPIADLSQSFCTQQNATLSDVQIIGQNIKWYDTGFSAYSLPSTTVLENDRTYYVSQTLNNCESERLAITVKIQDTPNPIANSPQQFCIQKNATINDIEIIGQNIKWYESTSSNNTLSEETSLENGITYYASQTISNCESDRIPITVNILEATDRDCINLVEELPFPKFFTPNGDGFNDLWTINPAYLAPNAGIKIFDRYGKFIKELAPGTSWDGNYIGRQEPAADYWFIVKRLNGTEFRGHFSLKR
ncbi:T9SS type B sorting domain-containing protein [Flavobacterium sp. SORGH_AS_0622]|uniref:T9SS type B sorting domain-containing protein n=1 Tax=Flavobacterium sp. SORGH_AS_0622 TaxID=3041772 RepID=UPI0027844860|nr:T9SS type B sorting domain-containing protein [Flavobacterium sp. SORGH_AS_0622]MDQ1167095.1 gliding motility-associated-like protein [Flavobacterium sp. SORGH_AS_0622]